MPIKEIKKKAGFAAAELVENGMTVGLGTGSTASYFIERLIQRYHEGLQVRVVASSNSSAKLAQQGGIPILDINQVESIDLTVDGADEIDGLKRMIKGGGGALVREKIMASMSREMVVVVDESKLCSKLGAKKLPVEVIPFGTLATRHKLEKLGYEGEWRKNPDTTFYVTDNGNFIFDVMFNSLREHPEEDHLAMIQVPGIVETGLFFGLAGRVIIGFFDGKIVVHS